MVFCLSNLWKFFTNWLQARRLRKLERKHTAYHEAGNAVVSHYLGLRVEHIFIFNNRQNRLQSFARSSFQANAENESRQSTIFKEITVLLAGRASEEMFMNTVERGSKKLINAWCRANFLVTNYDIRTLIGRENYGQSFDERVNFVLQNAYTNAWYVLTEHKAEVKRLALVLKKEDQLFERKIKAIINGNK